MNHKRSLQINFLSTKNKFCYKIVIDLKKTQNNRKKLLYYGIQFAFKKCLNDFG